MSADLASVMGRHCDGDPRAFVELHAALAPRVLGYLARMAPDRHTAEDLTQLTFLKVHRARAAYVRGADPVPWIFAIAHRTFLDEARRSKRARVRLTREADAVPEVAADLRGVPLETADDGAGADPEIVRRAMSALADLPARQREAVVLTRLSGKSIAEAAAITGTTPGAIKLRVHRAYVALRKALAAEGAP